MRFLSNHLLKKSLGEFLDSSLTMSKQLSNLCHTAYLEIRRLGIIRPFLTEKATTQLVFSRILNRLHCCSSLLAGATSEQLSCIQCVQNSAARVILKEKLFLKTTFASNQTKNRFQNCNISLQSLQQHFTFLPVSQAYCLYTV